MHYSGYLQIGVHWASQFEHLTCTTEGELARSVYCGNVGDEQYGIDTY
jgi:hypothetical protein